jgi:pimeloyl-ACP methyl ester carboxylesterase
MEEDMENSPLARAMGVPLIYVTGGDQSFAKLLPKMAEDMRAYGCQNVHIETIKNSGHYVADEQPEAVSELIERYASVKHGGKLTPRRTTRWRCGRNGDFVINL